MVLITLQNMLFLTSVIGVFSVILCRLITKTWISANTAYWVGWIFVLFATYICDVNGWGYKRVTELALSNILKLHLGAVAGFFFATVLCHNYQANNASLKQVYIQSENIVTLFSKKFYLILFLVGLLFLSERLAATGFDHNYLTEARSLYNQRNVSTMVRFGTHISVIVVFMTILLGVVDAVRGLNITRLLLVITASAPLSLANAGRAFLLSYLLIYTTSFFLYRSMQRKEKQLLTAQETIKISSVFVLMIFIFSVMGFHRGGYGVLYNPFRAVLSWPAASIFALDSWTKAALTLPSTQGLNSLGWIADIMDRISLVDYSAEKNLMGSIVHHFRNINDSAAVIPRTIIPDLIMDFGEKSLIYSMAFIAFCSQLLSIRIPHLGIFSFSLATLTILAIFQTIQSSIFSPGFCVATFWAFIFSNIMTKNSRKDI